MSSLKTCIVIPCYNEEKRLPKSDFVGSIQKKNYDFFFVDDGSRDDTHSILQEVVANSSSRVLKLEKNRGKAEAVRTGILEALKNQNYQYLGFLDADLATPLEEVEQMLRLLDEDALDLVIASRFQRLGSNIQRNPARHYIGRVFATAVSEMLGLKVYDTQCGAKFFEASIARTLFEEPFVSPWFFDVELFFRYKSLVSPTPEKIYEHPLKAWQDISGSKLTKTDFLRTPLELAKIWRHYKNS